MASTVTVTSRKIPSASTTGVTCGPQDAGAHATGSTNGGGGACEGALDDDDWNGFNPFLTDRLKHLELLERLAVDAKAFFSDEGDEEEEDDGDAPEATQSLPSRTRPLTHTADAPLSPDQSTAKPAPKKPSGSPLSPPAGLSSGAAASREPAHPGLPETKPPHAKHPPQTSGTRHNVSTQKEENTPCGTSDAANNSRAPASAPDSRASSSGSACATAAASVLEPQETKAGKLRGLASHSAGPSGTLAGRGANKNAAHDGKVAEPVSSSGFSAELVLDPPEIPPSLQTVLKLPAQGFKGSPTVFSSVTIPGTGPAELGGALIAEAFNKSDIGGSLLRVWRSQPSDSKQGAGAIGTQGAALLWDVVLPAGHSVTHMRLIPAPKALLSLKSPRDVAFGASRDSIECHVVVVTVPVLFGDGAASERLADPSLFSSVQVFDALTGVCFFNAPFLTRSRSAKSAERPNKAYGEGAVVRLVVPKVSAPASGDLDGPIVSAPRVPSFLVAVTCYGTLCVLQLEGATGCLSATSDARVSQTRLSGVSSLFGSFANHVVQAALRHIGLTVFGDASGASEEAAKKTPHSPSAVGDPKKNQLPVVSEKASSTQHNFAAPSVLIGASGSLQILLHHSRAASTGAACVGEPSIKPLRISGVDLLDPWVEDKEDDASISNPQLQQEKNHRDVSSAIKRVRVIVYMSNGLVYGCMGLPAAAAGFAQLSDSGANEELEHGEDATSLGWVRVDALEFVHSDFFRYHDVTVGSVALHPGRGSTAPPVWSLARLQGRSWSLCQAMRVKSCAVECRSSKRQQAAQNGGTAFAVARPPLTGGAKLGVTKRDSKFPAAQSAGDDSHPCPKLDRTLLGKVLLQCLQASPLGQTLQLRPIPTTSEGPATTLGSLATTRLGHCNLSLDHLLHQVQASVIVGSRMECLAWLRLLVQRVVDLESYGVLSHILIALSLTARKEALINATENALQAFTGGSYQSSGLQPASAPYQGATRRTWGDYGQGAREEKGAICGISPFQRACFPSAQRHSGLLNEDDDEDGDVFISKTNKNTNSANTGTLEILCSTPSVLPNAVYGFPAFPARLKTTIEQLQLKGLGCKSLFHAPESAEDSAVFGWTALGPLHSMHLTATELIDDITKVLKTLSVFPGTVTDVRSSDLKERCQTEKAEPIPCRAQHIQKLICNVEEVLRAITKDSAAWAESLRNVCGMAACAAYQNEQHLLARRSGEHCNSAELYGKGKSVEPAPHIDGQAYSSRTLTQGKSGCFVPKEDEEDTDMLFRDTFYGDVF